MILTSDGVRARRERENLTLGHQYSFSTLWITGGFLRYQRNLELGLQRRWQQALAIGRKFWISSNQHALVLTGIATNQERNLEGVESTNTEVILLLNYHLFSFEKPDITVSILETSFLSLTQQDRFRLDGDLNLSWEMISDFSVSLTFYHNYDSQSPATGESNIDIGFVGGLRYEF